MKKQVKNTSSIKELMGHITTEMYTRQTIVSLFRCFLETIIESRYDSVVLVKLNNPQEYFGLLNRLKYTNSKVYNYSENAEISELKDDEFLIIIAERFSACLYWDESTIDVFGLSQGFCSLNPYDTKQIIDYLQSLSYNEDMEKSLEEIKQDRRQNERFTTILRKLTATLETRQRDLICANTELEELQTKSDIKENTFNTEQFCASIAHEIRNPLGMMDLYEKIISKGLENIPDSENLTNAATSIRNAITGLESILSDLINYAKPMSLKKTQNNVKEAVEQVLNLAKPLYDEKKIELKSNWDLTADIQVSFDKNKISQALLNLIKNALETSKESDVVEVSIYMNGKNLHINVKDHGEGVSLENRDKLFTPYFTTKKNGTGLGLAGSRKILEAHGGVLNLISTSSNGSIFELTLPVE